MSQSFSCPSCSAPLEVEHRFSRVVICQYCNQTSEISPAGLDPTGKAPALVASPSILSLGATGQLLGKPFRVLGRLRYQYDGGFWDEWFCDHDGGQIWLQEDDGEFTAFTKETLKTPVPDFYEVGVGSSINVNDRSIFVVEVCESIIAGGEGELYFRVSPGMEANCVDGNSDGEIYSIEYTPEEINLSRGREVPRSQIVVS